MYTTVVCDVDIGGMVDHHYLNFSFHNTKYINEEFEDVKGVIRFRNSK